MIDGHQFLDTKALIDQRSEPGSTEVLDELVIDLTESPATPTGRVAVDGKFFAIEGRRFHPRGVTYGTFRERSDGHLYPATPQVRSDFKAIAQAGFTVVRTYSVPPPDVVTAAENAGLRLLAGVFYPDWRYLVGKARGARRRVAADAHKVVRDAARQLAGNPTIMALVLGNEIPADVVRWEGTKAISKVIASLVEVVREEDPRALVTYGNYPTTEYLPLDQLDFLTFNVFLEDHNEFRRYLTRLHHLAGDRPLVLGEIGLDAGTTALGERAQAELINRQMETALERGVAGSCLFSWTDEWCVGGTDVDDWHFGLTRGARSPRPSLEVAQKWNTRTVRDLDVNWPSISVVICAYNEQATIDECLRHTCALDYPNLEIIVIDDGSTDLTATIAASHPRAQVVTIDHAGLSSARNEGYRVATGELIAYLDSDAYPSPEWPYFLALGMDRSTLGGVGGPNVPPLHDPIGARQVALAPGGPVHVLFSDDRAEHIPGCNMAFWKDVLIKVGGFDPVYTSAGDDVDFCWRVLDRGYEIGFHPAALVWHHRRAGLRPYLRQQRGYGRSEALVEARHPDRFTPIGTARWKGRIYDTLMPGPGRQRIYRGLYGAAAYQSVYQDNGHLIDLVHQVGVPLAVLSTTTLPLAILRPALGLPALGALIFLAALVIVDALRTRTLRDVRERRWRFRFGVAFMMVAQPLVRTWGRTRNRSMARKDLSSFHELPEQVHIVERTTLLMADGRPRAQLAAAVVETLHQAGIRIFPASGWESHDATLIGSSLVFGQLVTSSHPEGSVQLRVHRRARVRPLAALAVLAGLTWFHLGVLPTALVATLGAGELSRGWWRTGPLVRKVLTRHRPRARSETAPTSLPNGHRAPGSNDHVAPDEESRDE